MLNMRSPEQSVSGKNVKGEVGRAARTFELVNDFNLPGNMLVAQRKMALSLSEVCPNEPKVHPGSIRLIRPVERTKQAE
ncbi:hypothetical protein [Bradyrhizobium sp. DOA1]|uniref:hypothetical protein n=1 Tax=Bradyrhizobium sp. DOA1 TaxID=1126616 RepID=UPI0012E8B1A2|nr:hypothetical protein [Bradyrhizobium sp. DOA1]